MPTLTNALLRTHAGGRSYDRGLSYTHAVSNLRVLRNQVLADVTGTGYYEVRLYWSGDELVGDCSCPYGQDGAFCKHCVAVGLVLLETRTEVPAADHEEVDLREFLHALDHAELAELLYEQVGLDEDLTAKLRMLRAERAGSEVLLREIHETLSVNRAEECLAALRGLANGGHHAEVLPIVEQLVSMLFWAQQSDPHLFGSSQLAVELHVECCREAAPDPLQLADWVLHHRLNSDVEVGEYEDALGEVGLAWYRSRAEQLWRDDPDAYAVAGIMEEVARDSGDTDLLLEILNAGKWNGMRIVQALAEAGRVEEAVAKAEAMLGQDARVPDFLVAQYLGQGKSKKALALRRRQLDETPRAMAYRQFRDVAEQLDVWTGQRLWALGRLREYGKQDQYTNTHLVAVLLEEADFEAAWAEAQAHGCSEEQWRQLAELREPEHPLDAIAVYQRIVQRRINMTGKDHYAEAAGLLAKIQGMHPNPAAFASYLTSVRAEHKAKRNFMAALAKRGL
jgi:uncharacterized Zn finger protein